MSKKVKRNPRGLGRKWALQYLYQNDISAIKFKEDEFILFIDQIENAPSAPNQVESERGFGFARELIQGVQEHLEELDLIIAEEAKNWKLDRMAVIDRNILRITCFELSYIPSNHPVVIVNEAVELAKIFGDSDSFKFVNGIADTMAHRLRSEEMNK